MVLASSDPGDTVIDPFAGSGTTARVCQQLNRISYNVEINSEYVDMINNRLSKPFDGFDSIDPRMERVPLDMRDKTIREEYLQNHVKWFLKGHANALPDFISAVKEVYGERHDFEEELYVQQLEIRY